MLKYDWSELRLSEKFAVDTDNVHDLRLSPQGDRLLIAGGVPGEAGWIDERTWPEQKSVRRFQEHHDLVYQVAWAPDGGTFASACADGTCSVFGAESGAVISQFRGHSRPVLTLMYLDNATVASAGVDHTIRLWDVNTSQTIRTLNNHLNTVNGLAVSPLSPETEKCTLASISEDRTVRLWLPRIGRLLRFARVPSAPRCVAWSPDARELYVGCSDGFVRVFAADAMRMNNELDGRVGRIHELVVAPDNKTVIVGGELGIQKLDVEPSAENYPH
ncbi:MAG: hypothetical protein U0795_17410 [Pirellulales bacterium]